MKYIADTNTNPTEKRYFSKVEGTNYCGLKRRRYQMNSSDPGSSQWWENAIAGMKLWASSSFKAS
jgi:hypothetical protein